MAIKQIKFQIRIENILLCLDIIQLYQSFFKHVTLSSLLELMGLCRHYSTILTSEDEVL